MSKPDITAARLRELLHYNPATGEFTWLVTIGMNAQAGDIAGSTDDMRYRRIGIEGRRYRAHRLAWLYMTGKWPASQIDHEDTNKGNNRWKNLREATGTTNGQNRRSSHGDNSTGLLGVTFCTKRQLFVARIWDGKRNRYLGQYAIAEDAHAAYVKAKRSIHPGNTL